MPPGVRGLARARGAPGTEAPSTGAGRESRDPGLPSQWEPGPSVTGRAAWGAVSGTRCRPRVPAFRL